MKELQKFTTNQQTKILVPANNYDLNEDKRLLIPFTQCEKIGFMNREGDVVLEPQFDMYYGECYNQNDLIEVSKVVFSGYRYELRGLINYKGEKIFDTKYREISQGLDNKNIFVVRNQNYGYGVVSIDDQVIVPFGEYIWIDVFEHGIARVIATKRTKNVVSEGQVTVTIKSLTIEQFKKEQNIDKIYICENPNTGKLFLSWGEEFIGQVSKKVQENRILVKENILICQLLDLKTKEKFWCLTDKDEDANKDIHGKVWDIINEKGEKILPIEYDYIWRPKNKYSVRVEKNGIIENICIHKSISDLKEDNDLSHNKKMIQKLNEDLDEEFVAPHSLLNEKLEDKESCDYDSYEDYYYGGYDDAYTQDDIDDLISDAFEGDPDAYWNID